MFWADEILKDRKSPQWINDAWTPSGIIHMGGLKGPIIHDTLFKILKQNRIDAKYTFGFDDLDPIDGLPKELQESLNEYMGVPICYAPSPDGEGTFGEFYGKKMRALFKSLGIDAQIYPAEEYYKKGIYDKAIKFVLDNTEKIKKVYAEMYKKDMADDWFPFQVICPNCKKLGTTKVIGWDGEKVEFVCEPNLVIWAKGCSEKGKISPFGGNGKMPFKVEWAAKWWTFGVTIEGAGKDHASAGGTYDVARKILKDVFGNEPPLWLPYEFFLYDGKKMSSSKGLGLTGEQLMEVMPPELVRFLMIKTNPKQAVEFNPNQTQIIPKLYDDYQSAASSYFDKSEDDIGRAFELSQIGEVKRPPEIRFSVLVQWVQMPNMEEEIKKNGLQEWVSYAKKWIEKYASDGERFTVQQEIPQSVINLSLAQKSLLSKVAGELKDDLNPEEFQTRIYDIGKELGLNGKETFAAIYTALIGKDHGPKAAWLILSLDSEFVKRRFSDLV